MNPTLSPRLTSIRDELAESTARMHRIADPLDDATWRARPGDGRWGVAECIEHLNMSSRQLLPRLREGLRAAPAPGSAATPSFRLDFMGWFLVRSLEPPPLMKFKTTEDFTPPTVESKESVMREWESLQSDLAALLAGAGGVPLGRVRVTSPFNPKIRYNAYSAFRIAAAHQRRHLWQAERALESVARPAR